MQLLACERTDEGDIFVVELSVVKFQRSLTLFATTQFSQNAFLLVIKLRALWIVEWWQFLVRRCLSTHVACHSHVALYTTHDLSAAPFPIEIVVTGGQHADARGDRESAQKVRRAEEICFAEKDASSRGIRAVLKW